jgi:hypothetical protein
MHHQTGPKVVQCLNAATDARRNYERTSDPDIKLTYLQIEQCWYRLADQYALTDQLEAFLKAVPKP